MELSKRIEKELRSVADSSQAVEMSAYMKNRFPFLGVKSPDRKGIQSELFKRFPKLSWEEVWSNVAELWAMEEREFQYVAADLLRKNAKKLPENFLPKFEYLITHKSWWDSVDSLVPSSLGTYFLNYPNQIIPATNQWIKSENIWLQRAAILFQLKYKADTDFDLMISIIEQLKAGKEFFVNKAIGWALREYSKTNPTAVEAYVSKANLSHLSTKEALKVILKNKQA